MQGKGKMKTSGAGVGYVYREVDGCPFCDRPHRHIKEGDGSYTCSDTVTWCADCGWPRRDAGQKCPGCEALAARGYKATRGKVEVSDGR